MAATRDEFPDLNLLAAFGLEEVENEKDAINAGKNEASSEHNNKKRTFAETNNQDLDDIVKNSHSKQTKKATQWAVSVFTGWLKQYESIFIQHYYSHEKKKQQQQQLGEQICNVKRYY